MYSGEGCSLLLLGDTAQLPPVMQPYSPALEADKLLGYGLHLHEFTLTHVVRQALESGILHNATSIRNQLNGEHTSEIPRLELDGFDDIRQLNGEELIDEIQRSYDGVGVEDTIVVTRSNRITSYNVCYTKLLRVTPGRGAGA